MQKNAKNAEKCKKMQKNAKQMRNLQNFKKCNPTTKMKSFCNKLISVKDWRSAAGRRVAVG